MSRDKFLVTVKFICKKKNVLDVIMQGISTEIFLCPCIIVSSESGIRIHPDSKLSLYLRNQNYFYHFKHWLVIPISTIENPIQVFICF